MNFFEKVEKGIFSRRYRIFRLENAPIGFSGIFVQIKYLLLILFEIPRFGLVPRLYWPKYMNGKMTLILSLELNV
jgi:hypothetical protein